MTLHRNGFLRILVIAVLLILAALVLLNIILDRKIAADAPGYIERLSKESGYIIELKDIGLDPLFNLRIRGLRIIDPSKDNTEIAAAKKITVDPAVISSLIQRRIIINQILVLNPGVVATKENIDNVLDVFNNSKKDEEDTATQFIVREIKLSDANFKITPDTELSSNDLSLFIQSTNKEGFQDIGLIGDLIGFGGVLDIKGSMQSNQGIASGVLSLGLEDISFKESQQTPLSAGVEINFEYSDVLSAFGTIDVRPHDSFSFSKERALSAEYEINYEPDTKKALLEKLQINIEGLLEGEFAGSADMGSADPQLEISGSATTGDLNELKGFLPSLAGDQIVGAAKVENIKIGGSLNKRDFSLTGDLLIDDLKYERPEAELGVSGLNCDIRFSQDLNPAQNYTMESSGTCASDKFNWDKTGEIDDITSNISINSKDVWDKIEISLSELKGSFMDGALTGSIGFDIESREFGMRGLLTGTELNLEKTPKSVIPFDINGRGDSVTASFSGGSGIYDADISLSASELILSLSKGRAFKISEIMSKENLGFKFTSAGEDVSSNTEVYDNITITNKGLAYKDLSFGDYLVKNGRVKDISFSLDLGGDWTLAMASSGSDFQVLGKDIYLKNFNESLSIENSGRGGFSGRITGRGGKFKAIEFPNLEWDYSYFNNFIKLSALKADIGTIGRFETNNLNLRMGQGGGYPFVSDFSDSTFIGLDKKVSSETVSGDFIINDPYSGVVDWEGNLDVKELYVLSQPISNLHIDVAPTETGLVLENIDGEFLAGSLTGKIDVDTSGPRARIQSDTTLSGASLAMGDTGLRIAKTDFNFSGLLPESSLPEGSGKLIVQGLTFTKGGKSYTYRGEVNGTTEGETLFIENGFISDKESKELSFTGKMVDSLNEKRTLRLNMPAIQIPTAISILRPFMPDSLSGAKTRGQADLELVFHKLFYPGQTWGGKLGVLRGEYMGTLAGTDLIVKEIYGTVTIKEDADSENPLSSHLKNGLKLSKTIYKKFLKSIKEFDIEEDSDYLKIGSLQYGIIKIEDIDTSLEVDREEINLKRLSSKAFKGGFYATGTYKFQDPGTYNISFLLDEVSLKAISDRVSPNSEYITGRVNGLAWITGEGGDLNTIDGPFMFWATNSPKEPRRVGQALLDRLGARERLILGSSRGYDRGEISGYINDGVLTFREFRITNSILGFRNLNIKADPRQNSISINHLISVIRELTRRSLTGGPTIETN